MVGDRDPVPVAIALEQRDQVPWERKRVFAGSVEMVDGNGVPAAGVDDDLDDLDAV